MTLAWAQGLVLACAIYLALGFVFALLFVSKGLQRVDAAAQGMPWLARLLIFPGVVALWPLMLKKWLRGEQPPVS